MTTRRGFAWFLFSFTVLWWGLVGWTTAAIYPGIRLQERAQTRFQVTRGVILSSVLSREDIRRRDSLRETFVANIVYSPQVTYRYEVAGVPITSFRYTYDTSRDSDPSYAAKVVESFPRGKSVPVYYNPDCPTESVLQLALTPISTYLLLFLRVFWGGALLLALLSAHFGLLMKWILRYCKDNPTIPCIIPGWGGLRRTRTGYAIIRRSNFIMWPLALYTLLILLWVGVLQALGLNHNQDAQRLAVQMSTGTSIIFGVALFLLGSSKVSIDLSRGDVRVERLLSRKSIKLSEVSTIQVGWVKARSKALSLYLEGRPGTSLRLNVFSLGDETTRIARQASIQISTLTGKPIGLP